MIRIKYSETHKSPRDLENMCTLWIWHPRYRLGDIKSLGDVDSLDEIIEYLDDTYGIDEYYYKPVNMYEHSSISLSVSNKYPYNDIFDSSICGIIFVTKEKIKREYSNIVDFEEVIGWFEKELSIYNCYLNGDVYDVIDERQLIKPFSINDRLVGKEITNESGDVYIIKKQTLTGIIFSKNTDTIELFSGYLYMEIPYDRLMKHYKFYPSNEPCSLVDYEKNITLCGFYGYKEAKKYIEELGCLDYLEEE